MTLQEIHATYADRVAEYVAFAQECRQARLMVAALLETSELLRERLEETQAHLAEWLQENEGEDWT